MSTTTRHGRRGAISAVLLCAVVAACSDDPETGDTASTAADVESTSAMSATTGVESTPSVVASPEAPPDDAPTVASTDPTSTEPATSGTSATTEAPPETDATSGPGAEFAEAPCDPVPSQPERVMCGFLDVPEHHAEPDGPTVRMAVAIVQPAGEPAGAEPVVYLAGGPGFGGVGEIELMLAAAPVQRTVILVDYRGVGLSQPSLHCDENDALGYDPLGLPPDDPLVNERSEGALGDCHRRFLQQGTDLAAFNYEEIAADLEVLRTALGHDQWDLWGLSNGGRVALETVRRYPDGVRSLVLDAPSPPQGNLHGDLWPNAQLAFDRLFARCAADEVCEDAYPDLDETYAQLVGGLGDVPVETVVPAAGDRPAVPVLFNDVLALNALRNAMYETPLIPLLPFYITELANGRSFDVVGQLVVERSGPAPTSFSDGMSLSVNCREEIAFLPPDHFDRLAQQLPFFAPVIRLQSWFDTCAVWDVGEGDPALDEPVISDVPTLVLVGELDPVHPPSEVRRIVDDGLSNATFVEVPGYGHGTIFPDTAACPAALMARFLEDPRAPLDLSCVAAIPDPAWLVP